MQLESRLEVRLDELCFGVVRYLIVSTKDSIVSWPFAKLRTKLIGRAKTPAAVERRRDLGQNLSAKPQFPDEKLIHRLPCRIPPQPSRRSSSVGPQDRLDRHLTVT